MSVLVSRYSPPVSVSFASSKAERPPSLSLYPNVEGMVRGGLGGARMVPGKDIWQVSELGQSTFCSAYQVGQTAALSSSTTTPAAWGVVGGGVAFLLPVPLATPTRTNHNSPRLLVSLILFTLCRNLLLQVQFVSVLMQAGGVL